MRLNNRLSMPKWPTNGKDQPFAALIYAVFNPLLKPLSGGISPLLIEHNKAIT